MPIKACLKDNDGALFFHQLACTELSAPSVITIGKGLFFRYKGMYRVQHPNTKLIEEYHQYVQCRGCKLKDIVLRPDRD